jgi:hypothetical protein
MERGRPDSLNFEKALCAAGCRDAFLHCECHGCRQLKAPGWPGGDGLFFKCDRHVNGLFGGR